MVDPVTVKLPNAHKPQMLQSAKLAEDSGFKVDAFSGKPGRLEVFAAGRRLPFDAKLLCMCLPKASISQSNKGFCHARLYQRHVYLLASARRVLHAPDIHATR